MQEAIFASNLSPSFSPIAPVKAPREQAHEEGESGRPIGFYRASFIRAFRLRKCATNCEAAEQMTR